MNSERNAIAAGLPARALVAGIMGRADAIIAIAIALAIVLKFVLAFRINIHWDEFYYLSFVHDYARATLDVRLQTFHVHFFSWLTKLGTDEVGQIIAGRLVMAALASASALLTYLIARRFAARGAALFGVLCYLSLNFVLLHGASFRTDPIATFLVLLAVYAALRQPGRIAAALIAGAALGLATLVTIKTSVYYPALAAMIWCQPATMRERAVFSAFAALAFAVTFGPLYLLHDASLAAQAPAAAAGYLGQTASGMLLREGLLPRMAEFLWVVRLNPLFWILALAGAITAMAHALRAGERAAWLPLALALPLLTPLVYRNAFAYYYAFALPTSCVLVALLFEKLRQMAAARARSPAATALALLIAAQIILLAMHGGYNLADGITPQRRVLKAVHAVFPRPTPYIDAFGVVATFPRHSFFMSSLGLQNYRDAGRPVFPSLAARDQPPMLLVDSPSLYAAMFPGVTVRAHHELLPEDKQFLNENYLQHWDILFVAGKRLLPPAPDGRMTFQVAIAGEYKLESAVAVDIDGARVPPGGNIRLGVGGHRLTSSRPLEPVILRWAAARPAPDGAPVGLNGFFGRTKFLIPDASSSDDGAKGQPEKGGAW